MKKNSFARIIVFVRSAVIATRVLSIRRIRRDNSLTFCPCARASELANATPASQDFPIDRKFNEVVSVIDPTPFFLAISIINSAI